MSQQNIDFIIRAREQLEGINKALAGTKRLRTEMKQTAYAGRGLSVALKTVAFRAAGIAASVVSVQRAMKALERGDTLLRTAEALAMNGEQLQQLELAAKDAEVEFTELTKKLTEIGSKGQEVLEGNLRLGRAFAELGVNMQAFRSASPDEQLEMIARGFAHATDRGKALRAVFQIMGEDTGPDMLKLLKEIGDDGLQGLIDKTGHARRVLDDWEVQALADMRARVRDIGIEVEFLFAKVTAFLVSGEMRQAMLESLEAYAVYLKSRFGEVLKTLAVDFPREMMNEFKVVIEWLQDGLIIAAKSFALAMAEGLDEPIRKFNALMGRIPDWAIREGMRPQLPTIDTSPIQDDIAARQGRFMQGREGYVSEQMQGQTLNQVLIDMLSTSAALERFVASTGDSFTRARVDAEAGAEPTTPDEPMLSGDALTVTDQLREALEVLHSTWGDFEDQMAKGLSGALKGGIDDLTSGISGLVKGTQTWGQMWQNVGSGIIDAMIQIGVQMAATKALGSVLRQADTAETIATETAKTPVLATNAGLAAASSYGTAAVIGIGLLLASMAAMKGFSGGGFTGSGGKYQPAGVVHRGEYVFDAESTRRIGVAQLEAMRFASALPGYADGGAVSLRVPTIEGLARESGAAGGGTTEQHFAYFDTRRDAEQFLRSREGEKFLIDFAKRNYFRR